MKRSPLKRSTKRIAPFSAKRSALRDERRAFVERILSERPYCEGPEHLRPLMRLSELSDRDRALIVVVLQECGIHRRSAEVHEKRKRSRGGSIVDASNCLCLCHGCHLFTEEEPRLATLAGMLTPSWEK